MKILVVDDDEFILELLIELLDTYGYDDVIGANSGDEALDKIALSEKTFDCFMLDIQMPGMDGIELCRRIRNLSPYKDSPVVMITAMSDKDYIERAFLAGATDYVTKPFDPTELISRIRLADRLQSETRRANQATVGAQNKQKPPFSAPVSVKDVNGFVNRAILENYVKINATHKQFPLGAIALRIPELEIVHAESSSLEFAYVVSDIAEVLAESFSGANAFMTYLGNGIFICVGNRHRFDNKEEIQEGLLVLLNDEDHVYCEDVQTCFSVHVGDHSAPKLFERKGNFRFLDRALENVKKAESLKTTDRPCNIFSNSETPFAA